MNRAERRRQEREATKNPTYTLSAHDIESIKNSATRDAIEGSFVTMLGFATETLEIEFNWSEYMINEFVDAAILKFDDAKKDRNKMIATIHRMADRCEE